MKKFVFLVFGVALLGSGCETLSSQQRRQREARIRNDIANLKASIARLNARLDGIEAGREDIYSQISRSQANMSKSEAQYRAEIAALENKLKAQDAARERMRKEMVADLSSKMEKIIKSQTPTSGYQVPGVLHTVKKGQTLSEIAKAYGVSIKAILKANPRKLKNANDLQIGQKIIIPD